MSCPSCRTVPTTRAPGTTSCMRSRQPTNVDLPHPDGPMIAVTALRHGEVDVAQHVTRAEPGVEFRDGDAVGDRHLTAPTRPRVTSRAIKLTTSTSTIKTSAPAHAWRCQSSYGAIA